VRVLVTGGTGYLGGAVVRALHRAAHDVVLFGRHVAAPTSDSATPATTPVVGDIRDTAAVTAAARGCDAILHMAALVAIWRRRRQDFDDVNVGGLQHVIDAANACGIGRVVYTSSFLALPPAGLDHAPAWNDYQRTKADADALASAAVERGAPIVRLYPGVIYGPGALTDGNLLGRQIADHLVGRLPGIVGAERIWSFAYVDDVAAAHVAALTQGRIGGRYQVGGENAPQMRAYDVVRTLTGRTLPRRLPGWLVAAGAAVEHLRAVVTGGTPLVTPGTLEILRHDWPLDSGRAQEELGYRITPLEKGIRAIVQQLTGGDPAAGVR
jgi:NAD+-dependent farnesol dehydrogenase